MDIQDLRRRAAAGELVAQTVLGACYVDGIDVEVDHARAREILLVPANLGVPRACYYLGRVYSSGRGVPPKMPEALRLLERAAKAGEFFAMIELGRIYANGRGIPVDPESARKWYVAAVAEEKDLEGCDEELREAKAYLEAKA